MKMKRVLGLALAAALSLSLVACGGGGGNNDGSKSSAPAGSGAGSSTPAPAGSGSSGGSEPIYVGFAQVGHESDWRTASTKSAQDVFSVANGYELSFVDCEIGRASCRERVSA